MTEWFDIWRNLTPGQGTLFGGAFVLCAGILTFGTGSLDRKSRAKRLFYEEMKALYAQALRIGRDLELLKAVPPDGREKIVTEKIDAMQKVISELALTGNYQTADLAIAYTYQQSVQLAVWSREVEHDIGLPDQVRRWLDNMTDEELAALKEYGNVRIDRRDVVEALRAELALYVPRWSRYRRVMRRPLHVDRYVLN
ncbi:MAG TPA: hypothetical protein VFC01_11995 [Mycobacterium sp.]|nr:hypothetical protein [Mycobacterium sp.]